MVSKKNKSETKAYLEKLLLILKTFHVCTGHVCNGTACSATINTWPFVSFQKQFSKKSEKRFNKNILLDFF